MNDKNYKLIFIFVIFLCVLSSCDMIYKNVPFVAIPPQAISGSVEIGSNWTEITPPQPLKPLAATNWISLGCKNYKEFKSVTINKENILELADGRKTKIEAFLLDDNGESYELELNQTSNGPQLDKKGEIKIVNGKPDYSGTKFPSDRVYVRLKIRSEIPLRCDKIEWIGSNPQ